MVQLKGNFMKTARRTPAQMATFYQVGAAEMYANARNCVPWDSFLQEMYPNAGPAEWAAYWQRSAESTFIQAAHRMKILDDMLATCCYWQVRAGLREYPQGHIDETVTAQHPRRIAAVAWQAANPWQPNQ